MGLLTTATPTLSAAPARAATTALIPGSYLTERGWGQMDIWRDKSGVLKFSLEAIGANVHVCTLEGSIDGMRAKLEGLGPNDPCEVEFKPFNGGVLVDGTPGCRAYCGARAGFEGPYLRPPAACTPAAQARTRRAFKAHYDAKRFAEARATLEPLLKTCAEWWPSNMDGDIRNDLAVTLHKLGDLAGCRALLKDYAEDAALSDEEIRGGYPPSDAENYLNVLRKVRTNLKLCREMKR
ncbi:MAG: hypothetical protein SF172_16790 [Burkholderiales bacterium]|nr:hypothetical protein [Burkholderiales bacterium]